MLNLNLASHLLIMTASESRLNCTYVLTFTLNRLSAKFFRTSYLTFLVQTRLSLFAKNLFILSLLDSGEYAPKRLLEDFSFVWDIYTWIWSENYVVIILELCLHLISLMLLSLLPLLLLLLLSFSLFLLLLLSLFSSSKLLLWKKFN